MNKVLTTLMVAAMAVNSYGQSIWDSNKNCTLDANGNCLPTTILTAMPFLRIAPDARGGAMGEAGIVADPSASSMHYNASNLAFAEENSGVSLNFTPWLRNLGLDDLYLTYLAGYTKLDKYQTLGFHVRYFSLGSIFFTDNTGASTGEGRPREFELGAAYARKLGDNFSAAVAGKFLYSSLAPGQIVGGILINNATSFATDVSLTYRKKTKISSYNGYWAIGMNISNLGAKVTYTDNADKDFIPTNLGLGAMMRIDFDDYNTLGFVLDINKLLVPSPYSIENPEWDANNDDVADWRQKTLFDGVFGSFSDAQAGLSEELKEFYYSIGLEYIYSKQFAVRGGYYYEHPLKGARKFFTIGAGIKYNVFEFNLSYLAPSSIQRNPLDNTLRFGLNFNFEGFKEGLEEE